MGRTTSGRGRKDKAAGRKRQSSKAAVSVKKNPPTRRYARSPSKKRVSRRRKSSQSTSAVRSWLRLIGKIVLRASAVVFVVLLGALTALIIYARDLPTIGDLEMARHEPRIEILASTGEIIGIRGRDRGPSVDIESLPPHVVDAFLATEDRNFYHHVGINPVAILRALVVNLKAGDIEQGGSTITQQLVKNLLLTPDRNLRRKVQEMLLALKIEAIYEKDEILSFYLNAVYFGNGAYGLEAAARRYFAKSPQELTIAEAAVLAGLLKAPSRYAPTHDREAAISRAEVVLSAMVEADMLTAGEAAEITFPSLEDIAQQDPSAAYAADYAYLKAREALGEIQQNITIHTTIDYAAMQSAVHAQQELLDKYDLNGKKVQSAVVVMDENGAVKVLIGGNDYLESSYNRAVSARRQPGSAFKPFVYLTALEEGFRPEDLINDQRLTIGDWAPENYKDIYVGMVPLTEAMARSLNAAAIMLQEEVGRSRVVDVSNRLGLNINDPGPSLALGVTVVTPLQLATAYLPLSSGGIDATPFLVNRITAEDGSILYENRPEQASKRVLDGDMLIAFDHMMRQVVTSGSGRRAGLKGHYAAGKTGTSQSSRDAWFAGYASGLVGVVWMGRDDDTPMEWGRESISGSGPPAELWSEVMTVALKNIPVREPTPYIARPRSDGLLAHLKTLLGENRRQEKPVKPISIEDLIKGEAAPGTQ